MLDKTEFLQNPGQVEIKNIILVSIPKGTYVNLLDYLVEINIYESLFSGSVSGTITLADSTNLISMMPLLGDEFLFMNIKTPGFSDELSIYKTFRVYAISDKIYGDDAGKLLYHLNFTTTETFNDLNNPIYRAFEGTPSEIISTIYSEYLQADRNISIDSKNLDNTKNPLTILDSPTNKIKFVSPGWTPVQCINWIASKSVPQNKTAANFLFWETTKGFYFGSTNTLFNNLENVSIGEYVYSESYINTLSTDERPLAMFAIKSMIIEKSFDQLDNTMTGYLANRLLDIDLYNKQYNEKDYDHIDTFSDYPHLNDETSIPLAYKNITRNPKSHIRVNYSIPKLHSKIENNFDEVTKYIFGNRRANLIELGNFKMQIVIPGRTDIEAGTVIRIKIPKKKPGPLGNEDVKGDFQVDPLYSGYYLITDVAHKINPRSHFTTLTITKDSFSKKAYDGVSL
jgi:hypothetical protein